MMVDFFQVISVLMPQLGVPNLLDSVTFRELLNTWITPYTLDSNQECILKHLLQQPIWFLGHFLQ